jgi:RNA polymerase sigma factor (sigma-70 family)
MSSPASDLLVQCRFKNLLLWRLMAGRTQTEVARACGVDLPTFGKLLNLTLSPFDWRAERDGVIAYTKAANRVADYFNQLPDDIFPVRLYQLRLPRLVEHEVSSAMVVQKALPSPDECVAAAELRAATASALGTLTAREEMVLRMTLGFDGGECSRQEIAEALGVTGERVRQIEAKAMRKLRHPWRSRKLIAFMPPGTNDSLLEWAKADGTESPSYSEPRKL